MLVFSYADLLVRVIREVETILGESSKLIEECEADKEKLVRCSIAVVWDIAVEELVTRGDLCWVRPRVGLKPEEENSICGRQLTNGLVRREAFTLTHLK